MERMDSSNIEVSQAKISSAFSRMTLGSQRKDGSSRSKNSYLATLRKVNSLSTNGKSVPLLDASDKTLLAERKLLSLSFSSIVLGWSIKDVQNTNLYASKVKPIPKRFSSLQAYYAAFPYLLLEETRSQMQQGLESIGSASYIRLCCVNRAKASDRKDATLKKFVATAIGDSSAVVNRSSTESPRKPKPTDIVVLSTLIPNSANDLQKTGEYYTFAQVTSLPQAHKLAILAYSATETLECKEMLDVGKKYWYATYLGNLATGLRTWCAVHSDFTKGESGQLRPLVQETLYRDTKQEYRSVSGNRQKEAEGLETIINTYCNFRHLNERQTEAVRSTVIGLVKQDGFRVRLIQGPPGTGKTSTTTVLVSIISCLTERFLVCAPTNRAISEVAERFVKQLKNNIRENSQFSDYTSRISTGMHFCRPLQMGDVVLIGNKSNLNTDRSLDDIYLPARVDRLAMALAKFSGWRHTTTDLAEFLKNPFVQFQNSLKKKETPAVEFGQFVKQHVASLVPAMIRSGQVLIKDLPTKMLSAKERKEIEDSCSFSKILLEVLRRKGLKSTKVRKCFTGKCSKPDDGKRCHPCDFCQAKLNLLQLLSEHPGYFIQNIGGRVRPWKLEKICLKNASLVFCTTAAAGSDKMVASGAAFEYAVIDEAAQLVEAEIAMVTQLRQVDRALLVGDPRQLQATVTSQTAKKCGYGRSLFERLQNLGHPCHVLNVQYRMHPNINSFPSRRFYNSAVLDGPNVLSTNYTRKYHERFGSYVFINIADAKEKRGASGKSWINSGEAKAIHLLIKKIRSVAGEKVEKVGVGVISPYRSQICELQKILKRFFDDPLMELCVKTVDGFQGGEQDVIIFSAVRANGGGQIGFLDDARRLNVAITRGRYCVWVVGNAATLAARNEMWKDLVEDARRRGYFFDSKDTRI